MTNEQREAIEYLKESVLIYKNTIPKISDAIDTALSLIKEQQEEIEKKDKQIDLMAELVYKRFKAELLLEYGFENEEQLKQYFAELVEKE
mgnify:CR=1 FL=1